MRCDLLDICINLIILNTKFNILNTKFIIYDAKFINFNANRYLHDETHVTESVPGFAKVEAARQNRPTSVAKQSQNGQNQWKSHSAPLRRT